MIVWVTILMVWLIVRQKDALYILIIHTGVKSRVQNGHRNTLFIRWRGTWKGFEQSLKEKIGQYT